MLYPYTEEGLLQGAVGVVERGEMDSVAGGDFLGLVDALLGRESRETLGLDLH